MGVWMSFIPNSMVTRHLYKNERTIELHRINYYFQQQRIHSRLEYWIKFFRSYFLFVARSVFCLHSSISSRNLFPHHHITDWNHNEIFNIYSIRKWNSLNKMIIIITRNFNSKFQASTCPLTHLNYSVCVECHLAHHVFFFFYYYYLSLFSHHFDETFFVPNNTDEVISFNYNSIAVSLLFPYKSASAMPLTVHQKLWDNN